MSENTFSYIKPAAVRKGFIGKILAIIEENGFKIVAMKKTELTLTKAKQFYAEHEGKPFYNRLMDHSTSGPIVALLLEKDNAISDFRELIGSTNPEDAKEGTIRKLFGETVTANAIHGSDAIETAQREAAFFFSELERF